MIFKNYVFGKCSQKKPNEIKVGLSPSKKNFLFA